MKNCQYTSIAAIVVGAFACGDDGGSDAGVDGNELRPDGNMDRDLDGIKDDVDNCPDSTNGFQGNEDGDKHGDACDTCPTIKDDAPVDGDGDGVADVCDPKPIMFGDRIKFFEGFHQGAPQGWDQAGTWSTNSDQLFGSAGAAGHFSLIVTDRTRETISTTFSMTSVGGTGSEIGVVDAKQPQATSAIACVVTGGNELAVYDTSAPQGAQKTAFTLTAGVKYTLALRRENSTYTCSIRTPGATTALAQVQKDFVNTTAPYQSGLVLNAAVARFDWLMIVESL